MILHAVARHGPPGAVWLVFLHGFCGDYREWLPVGEHFTGFSRLYIDLPGHGGSAGIAVSGFDDVRRLLRHTLRRYGIDDLWLLGYSLGGRIAMYFAAQQPQGLGGLVVEGAHPGLGDIRERARRQRSDARWAARFRAEALKSVFAAWYQQPVFASLNHEQRRELVALRGGNNGAGLARMLQATSLGRQPDLRAVLAGGSFPVHYLCGERDDKFRAIAGELRVALDVIDNAGHNAHRENPAGVIASLARILRYPE